MKLLTSLAAIIAVATAGTIYSSKPAPESYTNADIYQSALEYQQDGLYSDQSHAYAGASRPSGEKTARILSLVSERDGHGYTYSYETENGIKAQEDGQISGHESGTSAHGAYSYIGDDGHTYTVTYTADEHGFHPQGAHLPTPPPIPEAIAKSLEQNAKDEAAGIYDDGKYAEPEYHHEQLQQHEFSQQHQQQIHQQQIHQQQMHHQQLHQPQLHQQQLHQPQLHQQQMHQQQLHQPQLHQQQAAHAVQYETTAFVNDGEYQHGGYHTLNVPVEGYKKH